MRGEGCGGEEGYRRLEGELREELKREWAMDGKELIDFVVGRVFGLKDIGGGEWLDWEGRVRGFSLDSWSDAGEVVEAIEEDDDEVEVRVKRCVSSRGGWKLAHWKAEVRFVVSEREGEATGLTAPRAIIKAVAVMFGYGVGKGVEG